jgi:hypothetical protein
VSAILHPSIMYGNHEVSTCLPAALYIAGDPNLLEFTTYLILNAQLGVDFLTLEQNSGGP